MGLKLTDIVEGWYDPPEYPDASGESFVDEELNDVEDLFVFIGQHKESGHFIVQHKETKKFYLGHTDSIDIEYYQADTYEEYDEDEDGSYTYERVDKDNAVMTQESLTMFSTICYNEEDIAIDFDEWETGIGLGLIDKILLRGFYMYDKENYMVIVSLIKKHNEKTIKKNGR